MEEPRDNVSLGHLQGSPSLTRAASSWRKLLAAVWGVRVQKGALLCGSKKEKLMGKKGESAGGESSQGPDLCEAGLPLGKE